MNGPVKRPYQKRYDPSAMAYIMDRDSLHNRRLEKGLVPGQVVTVTAHFGVFRLVHNDKGAVWSVDRGSLKPVKRS